MTTTTATIDPWDRFQSGQSVTFVGADGTRLPATIRSRQRAGWFVVVDTSSVSDKPVQALWVSDEQAKEHLLP